MTSKILEDCLHRARENILHHEQYKCYLHYSFVVVDNKVIASGTNISAAPPIHFGYNKKSPSPKLHSELIAFRRARKGCNLKSFELVNVRLNRGGNIRISCPCFVCQSWLFSVGCSTVYFTTEGKWGRL